MSVIDRLIDTLAASFHVKNKDDEEEKKRRDKERQIFDEREFERKKEIVKPQEQLSDPRKDPTIVDRVRSFVDSLSGQNQDLNTTLEQETQNENPFVAQLAGQAQLGQKVLGGVGGFIKELGKEFVYNPESKRLFPQSPLYPENAQKLTGEAFDTSTSEGRDKYLAEQLNLVGGFAMAPEGKSLAGAVKKTGQRVLTNIEAKAVQSGFLERLAKLAGTATNQDDLVMGTSDAVEKAIKSSGGDKSVLSGIRTALNKEMFNFAGITEENFRAAYAQLKNFMDDPDMGAYLRTMEGYVDDIDNLLSRPTEEVQKMIAKRGEETIQPVVAGASTDDIWRPNKTTSKGENVLPSEEVARTSPSTTSTVTSSPSNKYTPAMSVEEIVSDPGFITKYNSTIQEEPYLKQTVKEIAGDREMKVGVKNLSTTVEKIVRKLPSKPQYSEEFVGDMLRGNMVANDPQDALELLSKVQQKTQVVSVENYIDAPNPWGYQGINVNVRTPKGNLAEIQIHTPASREVQKALHPLYEQWRHAETVPVEVFEEARKIANAVKTKFNEPPLGPIKEAQAMTTPVAQMADELPVVAPPAGAPPTGGPPGGGIPDTLEPIQISPTTGKLEKTTAPKYEFDLKSLNTPEEVKKTILEVARKGEGAIDTARRGTITFDQTRKLADALGMSTDDVKKRLPGRIFNAEQADAATRLALKANDDLTKIGQEVRALKEAGQAIPAEINLRHIEAAARAEGVTASVIGSRSEAARALNSAKMLKEAMDDPGNTQKVIEKMFGGDKEKVREVVRKLSEFAPEDTIGKAMFLRKIKPTTPLDMVEEWWYNSVLSNTATHIVNTVGNTASALFRLPEKVVSGTIDAAGEAIAKTFGKEYTRERFAAEAGAEATGIITGFSKGFRKAAYVMKNGIKEADVTKLEIGRGQAIKGPLGDVINIPSRALVAEDELFRGINHEMEIWALATREAKKLKLTGKDFSNKVSQLVSEPTLEMVEAAKKTAGERLFQGESKTAEVVARFRDNLAVLDFEKFEKLGALSKLGEFRPLRFIIPFVKTPIKVVEFGLERSPVGVLPVIAKAASGASRGEVMDAAAKTLIGSTIMVPLAMYFTQDKITGAPPKDRTQRDAFYAEGKLPYAIKIGDDWVSYNRVEPFNTLLSQIAIWHDAFENDNNVTSLEAIGEFLRGTAQNFVDQTFMTGMGNLVNAIEDPERYGEKFITDITGGFIPSIVAAGARATDKTVRKPETFAESLKARVPVLSQQVTPQESEFEPGGTAQRHTNDSLATNISSQFLGFRISKETGLDILDEVKKIQKINKAVKAEGEEETTTAQDLLSELVESSAGSREQILKRYAQAGKLNEKVVDKLTDQINLAGQDLQGEEKVLKNASHRVRAEYMYDKLKELDQNGRVEWAQRMMEKKLITETTLAELTKLIDERKNAQLPVIAP